MTDQKSPILEKNYRIGNSLNKHSKRVVELSHTRIKK